MSSLVHKHAVRLQPESTSRRRGLSSFAKHIMTAWEKPTPVVINAQRRLIHKVIPGGFSSCYVNFLDVVISPFSRCVAHIVFLVPCLPPGNGRRFFEVRS